MGRWDYNVHIDLGRLIAKKETIAGRKKDFAPLMLKAIEDGFDEIKEKLELKIRDIMAKYGLENSNLMANWSCTKVEGGLYITTSAINEFGKEYSLFVEYGTGLVGKGDAHPKMKEMGWVYDHKEHGLGGWWYPTNPNNPSKTLTQLPSGDWIAWTAGQKAKPFMYDTYLYASRIATNTLRKHINRAFREWGEQFK